MDIAQHCEVWNSLRSKREGPEPAKSRVTHVLTALSLVRRRSKVNHVRTARLYATVVAWIKMHWTLDGSHGVCAEVSFARLSLSHARNISISNLDLAVTYRLTSHTL